VLDISRKFRTLRTATAEATLTLAPETLERVRNGSIPKGDPLPVARVAAIQAAKNTSEIIPFCHNVPLTGADVDFELGDGVIVAKVHVSAIYRTGVEIEAITAASVAALTLYDMLKMIDDTMEIGSVKLLSKDGGKGSYRENYPEPIRAAVLVMSDSIAAGKKSDESGRMIVEGLEEHDVDVVDYRVIPDEPDEISSCLIAYADEDELDLVITTGGTGFSPRDTTPEAMLRVIEREIPGINEAARAHGQERTPYSMLSRGKAGLRGKTLIINLPGSRGGVRDSLDALLPAVLHSFKMIRGGGHEEKKRREGRNR
jgi:cyclic pyranopterin monophosphate synthase